MSHFKAEKVSFTSSTVIELQSISTKLFSELRSEVRCKVQMFIMIHKPFCKVAFDWLLFNV
jgi:hypothetical protein